MTYSVPHRPLWEWVIDLVQDPQLATLFHWDAERVYWWNGQSSTCIFNEPWTADAFWNVQVRALKTSDLQCAQEPSNDAPCQSQIPEGGNPLCLILYADKTKLSSFGTAKGYPVIARCGNLPAHIRNSNGFGGGRVVGWLPIVRPCLTCNLLYSYNIILLQGLRGSA